MISAKRLKEILENFNKVKIAVVGDMMLDEYLIGKVNRISPEAPVPVVNIEEERFVLGGASNVANNLKSLDAEVVVYGVVGRDENGEKFINELNLKKIDASAIVKDPMRPTIIKSRVLSQGQQLLRLDREKDTEISKEIQNVIIKNLKENIDSIDAILLSDYNKGVLTKYVSEEIINIANKNNKKTIVDPKPQNFKNYKGATSVTPNRKELLDYFGMKKFKSEDEIAQKMKEIKNELELDNVVLTRSEEGISLFENEHKRIPTVAREVYDVTGAGDTFISTFLLSISAGANLYEAGVIANMASGIVVGKVGTATATRKEILEFYHDEMKK
ncbi:D-glycero-beta-D-manno-heptose-7-phosphate kinase [Leptotrichia sp. OH3620_COT-345]|uniref:D-glycero-beta-D-manno-heptose-7-phosphate kinase n=1 Tax=Leptotrichia sp. OH3620_COT-345 TaxID=2491048 RepID=UPI000F6539EE|nr:D-glycero-beta-D-manno-heptose-7-phosphate kinase [Leptotrichia sp. OH3620_COT-345]RRD39346.1 D-glycero-beta-D-manno-heptose-7-phosphate kinase [Leptotrichia sp. OH3620_COT-345]